MTIDRSGDAGAKEAALNRAQAVALATKQATIV
jgi:hypothetical protein